MLVGDRNKHNLPNRKTFPSLHLVSGVIDELRNSSLLELDLQLPCSRASDEICRYGLDQKRAATRLYCTYNITLWGDIDILCSIAIQEFRYGFQAIVGGEYCLLRQSFPRNCV
jgi:hypothetical protein